MPTTYEQRDNWTSWDYRLKNTSPARPYKAPLEYLRMSSYGNRPLEGAYSPASAISIAEQKLKGNEYNQLVMRTYDELLEKIRSSASVGLTLAEGRKSVDMIVNRAGVVLQFFHAVKKGDFETIQRLARQAQKRKTNARKRNQSEAEDMFRDAIKSGSKSFLEYQWGWKPLVQDIQDSMEVLTEPIKSHWVDAKAKSEKRVYNTYTSQWNPFAHAYNVTKQDLSFRLQVRQGVEVAVDNPNLFLANQLGLINPVALGIELFPFSFLADWFTNLSQVANLITDYAGLTVRNGYTTKVMRGNFYDRQTNLEWSNPTRVCTYAFIKMHRTPGVLLPEFGFRAWKPWSVNRAMKACALLATLFIGDQTPPLTPRGKSLR